MKCVHCNEEMETGTAAFMPLQGMSALVLSYTSAAEAGKNPLKQKTKDTLLACAGDVAACYCPRCHKLTLTVDLE